MQPTFESYEEGFGAELQCPSCGSIYINHECVEIFDRGEDDETGLHVTITPGKLSVDNNLTGNPRKRRHGLRIVFDCEGCKVKPVLTIKQHKGNTAINIE